VVPKVRLIPALSLSPRLTKEGWGGENKRCSHGFLSAANVRSCQELCIPPLAGCCQERFLVAYLAGPIVAAQPMASMEQFGSYVAEVIGKLDEMAREWVDTEGRGIDPRGISLSCVFRETAPVPEALQPL
jgi:hypothetical protein